MNHSLDIASYQGPIIVTGANFCLLYILLLGSTLYAALTVGQRRSSQQPTV